MKKQNLVYSLKSNNQILIGLYLGIWAGDGTQYYDKGYRIKICCHSKDKKMIEFFKFVLAELFGKTIIQVAYEERNRALIRFKSKFIYNFVSEYLFYARNKTLSVCLKYGLKKYSNGFLDGFILGLALTDGYLKSNFIFNTVSIQLSNNVVSILKLYGFNPKCYTHNRKRYNWNNLHMVRLNNKESKELLKKLDKILLKLKCSNNFYELKYGGENGPAEI